MFFRPGNVSHLGRIGLTAATVQFNPLILFAAGEQGVWYDPSDLSTLFQDSAGTTPVTAVGQPVGRMLDKSGRGNHAFQTTAIDRPTLQQDSGGMYYLSCNGTNTWMQTSSINFTSTDKITIFAGIRTSSGTDGQIIELSATQVSNTGSFQLRSNLSAPSTYTFGSRGSTFSAGIATTPAVYTPPYNAVLTGLGNISGDSSIIRVNGSQAANSSIDQGSGSYGNYAVYLFRRGGTSLPFNGYFYGAIIRGVASTENEISKTERMFARKSGVSI